MRRQRQRPPTSPGEILREEFLLPLNMSQATLARLVGVDVKTINRLVNGHSRLSANIAIELGRIFETTPEFWLNAQNAVDLYQAEKKKAESSFELQHNS